MDYIGKTIREVIEETGDVWAPFGGVAIFLLEDEGDATGTMIQENFTIKMILEDHPWLIDCIVKSNNAFFAQTVLRVIKPEKEEVKTLDQFNINWTNVSIHDSWLSNQVKVVDRIFTMRRNSNPDRSSDESCKLERLILDVTGSKEYLHKTFEFSLYAVSQSFFLQFTPTEIIVGRRIEKV